MKAAALSSIRSVLARHPRLTYFGIGVFGEHRRRGMGGRRQVEVETQALRAKMLQDAQVLEFIAADAFLASVRPIPVLNRKECSYSLKHAVEDWLQEHGAPIGYVSHGMFIAAALAREFRGEAPHPTSSSLCFNMRQRDLLAASTAPPTCKLLAALRETAPPFSL